MEKFYSLSYDSLCNFARACFFVRLCGLLSVLIQWWQLLLEMLLMRPHYTTPHRCLRLTWPAQQQQQHNSRDWGDTVSSVVTRLWSSVDPAPLPHGQNEVYFIGEKFYFFFSFNLTNQVPCGPLFWQPQHSQIHGMAPLIWIWYLKVAGLIGNFDCNVINFLDCRSWMDSDFWDIQMESLNNS